MFSSVAACNEVKKVDFHLDVQVVRDDGAPVEAATVSIRYPVGIKVNPGGGFPTDRMETSSAKTDIMGKTALDFQTVPPPEGLLWIRKDGFYDSVFKDFTSALAPGSKLNNKADIKAILNPVKNPIPMYACDNTGGAEKMVKIPELNQDYGFDLKLAEALPPLGHGKTADFIFRVEGTYEHNTSFELTLGVRFPNPNDGVAGFLTPQRVGTRESEMNGSRLISSYLAPQDGYQQTITRTIRSTKSGVKSADDVDFHRNFYFRTRTKTDSTGKIVSANYGKIYGDFQFDAAKKDWGYRSSLVLMTTYFNPTPNDRNVEFDPKRNLVPDQNVTRP